MSGNYPIVDVNENNPGDRPRAICFIKPKHQPIPCSTWQIVKS